MTEIEVLQYLWVAKTRENMPDEILQLPIEKIRMAVERVEAGEIVFIPKTPVAAPESPDDSLAEWDTQDDGHLNSYGS